MNDDLGRADHRPTEPRYAGEVNRVAVVTVAGVIALVAAAGGAWTWWQQQRALTLRLPEAAAPAEVAQSPPAPASAATAAEPPEARHPIEASMQSGARPLPALDRSDATVRQALVGLLGAQAVASMLLTDGFVRNAVTTIDNLGRAHAAPRLWPVTPMPGRFTVQPGGDSGEAQIAAANAARYAPFVAFAASIDAERAAAFYKAHYPLFQAAYREIGYPRGHFNDRLVEVIDLLLATPQPAGPIAMRLTEVKGPLAPQRPWVRWEFADPALETLPAGQKMLLRMGSENAKRLKTQLQAFRHAVASR
jgi:hypothetical protein